MRLILCILILVASSYYTKGQVVDFLAEEACFGELTILINITESTDSIISTRWDFNLDGSFDEGSGDTVAHYFPTPGYHTAGMRVVFEGGNAKAIYKEIFIGYFPVPDFTYDNTCVLESTDFIDKSTIEEGEILDYIWDFGDGSPQEYLKNPTHVFFESGPYSVKLTVVSDLGCSNSLTKGINVDDKPDINLELIGDTTFYEGDSLIVRVIGNFDSVVWSNGYHGNNIIIKSSGVYTVNAYQGSCSDSRTIPVTVKPRPEFSITNVITPNGDGYNDKWRIASLDMLKPCSVSILNRWGQEVFSSSDYENDWGGTWDGKPLQEGTYYYIIKCIEGSVFKGPINIIR